MQAEDTNTDLFRERRILLVMPDTPLQDVLSDYLQQRGFAVFAALRTPDALAQLRQEQWDGVVVDWQLGAAVRWIGEAVARTNPQAKLVVLMPQGIQLRWDPPWLDTISHPFRPSALAEKLGVPEKQPRLHRWFQRVADPTALPV